MAVKHFSINLNSLSVNPEIGIQIFNAAEASQRKNIKVNKSMKQPVFKSPKEVKSKKMTMSPEQFVSLKTKNALLSSDFKVKSQLDKSRSRYQHQRKSQNVHQYHTTPKDTYLATKRK